MTQSEIVEIQGSGHSKLFFAALAGWLLVVPAADFAAGGILILAVDRLIVG
ncbi:MAG TPA: hypothetical protein VGW37_13755 [Terriglobia bacterium]|nr:hypothetical protein [Terriglobia bacterium]